MNKNEIKALSIVFLLLVGIVGWMYMQSGGSLNDIFPFSNNKHNGLYISNKSIMGVAFAWNIKDDMITNYSMENIFKVAGGGQSFKCQQKKDRIELEDGKILRIDSVGNIILHEGDINVMGSSMDMNLSMIKITDRTDLSVDEIMKILTTSYEKQKSNSLF